MALDQLRLSEMTLFACIRFRPTAVAGVNKRRKGHATVQGLTTALERHQRHTGLVL